jgi:ketosteroid isomerase-like protein
MSEANVEMARRGYEAFNRGDIDGAVADFAPDFEYVVAAGGLPGFGEVARGREGFRRFVETFWREFDKPNLEVHELIDAGDQVVVSTTMRGRGKHSGAETSLDLWVVWTERNGAVVRAQEFESKAEALEAAGLSE